MIQDFDAVVLADGNYPMADIPLSILRAARYVACCDGAANEYIRQGRVPDIIVGDGDSVREEYRKRYASLLHCIKEQESNDLTKTVSLLASMGKRSIAIVGATGKREDHTLGNISLLIEYMRQGLTVRMFTDHGIFIPCHDTTTLQGGIGRQISVFNISAHNLSAEGLAYPISDFTSWWQGTLNECITESFTIHGEGEYIIFVNY